MNAANPRGRPLLIWDGRCGFCRMWIDYFKQRTGGRLDYAISQEVADQFPQISRAEFSKSVQLVRANGSTASGARAVFEALEWEALYESIPLLAPVSEATYRVIAGHRNFFYWVTKLTFGSRIEPARFAKVQWLFLRLLAVIYMIAFASLAVQVTGLIGSQGIVPVQEFLAQVRRTFGASGYYELPSLFWLGASDAVLRVAAWAGVGISAVLLLGFYQRAALFALWALYLSFSAAGQVFLEYQWDLLLLEAGFLAIFFGRSNIQQKTVAWLYRLLVFRLHFLSGWVKLASGDASWWSLRALDYHFHTQPLPNLAAWWVDQLPAGLLHASTFAVLAIELAAPFLIFSPRLWRMAGAWAMLGLQALIFATGNYTFFNLLTAALLLFLFDDQSLRWLKVPVPPQTAPRLKPLRIILAVALVVLGVLRVVESVRGILPRPLAIVAHLGAPLMIVNPYGLFAVMTTNRPEIVIEGSDDAQNWRAYEFRYKPGDLNRAPAQVAPYQPRLDWQMWFAALDDYRVSPWFLGLAEQLLHGSPDVLRLLQRNPFPDHPPRYLRALLYEYSFTTAGERARTGAWWKRQPLGEFLPAISLRE
jgi:predicted DCC family thiol-disulfide oxidoreductase YuxK